MIVAGLRETQLAQNAAHVLLHRPLRDPQPTGNAGVGAPLRHQRRHLTLPRAEHRQRVIAPAGRHQLLHQRRIHHRTTLGDPLQRLNELHHVGDPAFEQVANPPAAGQQLHRVLDLGMRRQDQDARGRELQADHPGRLQTLGGIGRRHPDVDDHQLGRLLADQREKLRAAAGLPHHLETGALKQAGQTLPEKDVVLSEDHPQPGRGRDIAIPTGARLRGFPINRHGQDYRASHPL
jgi:hypothetical protein